MNEQQPIIMMALTVGVLIIFVFGFLIMMMKFYRRIPPGRALVITRPSGPTVAMKDMLVLPINHAEEVDLTAKPIKLSFKSKEALPTKDDDATIELELTLVLRVNATSDDILKVAERVGCAKTGDIAALSALFVPRFKSAIANTMKSMRADEIVARRDQAEDVIMNIIGKDLDGYVLDSVAIEEAKVIKRTTAYRGV